MMLIIYSLNPPLSKIPKGSFECPKCRNECLQTLSIIDTMSSHITVKNKVIFLFI